MSATRLVPMFVALALFVPGACAARDGVRSATISPAWEYENVDRVQRWGVSAVPQLDAVGMPAVLYGAETGRRIARLTSAGWEYHDLPSGTFGGDWSFDSDGNVHLLSSVQYQYSSRVFYWFFNWSTWTLRNVWTFVGSVDPYAVAMAGAAVEWGSDGSLYVLLLNQTYRSWPARMDHRVLLLRWTGTVSEEVFVRAGLDAMPSVYDFLLDAASRPHLLLYERGMLGHAIVEAGVLRTEVLERVPDKWTSLSGARMALDGDSIDAVWLRNVYDVPTASRSVDIVHGWSDEARWQNETVYTSSGPGSLDWPESMSLALDEGGGVHIAYFAWGASLHGVHHMWRSGGGWVGELVESGPTYTDTVGRWPSLLAGPDWRLHLFYFDSTNYTLRHAVRQLAAPHSARFDVHPETLNPRSNGRWVTACVYPEDADPDAIEISSLRLNGVPLAWGKIEGGKVVAKFDRVAFAATLTPGWNQVVLSGVWNDGAPLSAVDTMRLIG